MFATGVSMARTRSIQVGCGVVALLILFNIGSAGATTSSEDIKSTRYETTFFSTSSSQGCSAESAGENKDYKGNQILNDTQLAAVQANKPFYENSAKKYDLPWQMLAVIHYRESGLRRANPGANYEGYKDGVYQIYKSGLTYNYTPGPITDEDFQAQTDRAAQFIREQKIPANYKQNRNVTATSSGDAIKDTFLSYNGGRQTYAPQAASLGYDPSTQAFEGSHYVMNRADEKRDPSVNPNWKQAFGGVLKPASPNSPYGAFVVYTALGGAGGDCSINGAVAEGGLTLEQAKAFMMRYGENVNGFSKKQSAGLWNMCNGGGSNCVTFSYFFNHTFTDLPAATNDGNGVAIVGSLVGKGASGGTTPKVFATFSWNNHTGIVLGIHGDDIIVGHASCSNKGIGKGNGTYAGGGSGFVMTGKLSNNKAFWGTRPTGFAYPNNVDTAAIQEFIEKGYVSNK